MARRAAAFLYGLSRALHLDPRWRAALGFCDTLLAGLASDGGLYVPERWPELPRVRAGESYARVAAGRRRRVRGRRARARPAGAAVRPGLRGPPPSRGLPARATRRRSSGCSSSSTADAGLQGPRAAARRPALRARAERARRAHHGARRDLRRHRLGGHLGARLVQPRRDRRALSGGPRERRPAAPDDDGRRAERPRRRGRGHVRRLPADRQGAVRDAALRERAGLAADELDQLGRIAAQVAYYVWATGALGGRALAFAVPTGNSAMSSPAGSPRACGLPLERLMIGSNANDILPRLLESGRLETRGVVHTLSPSMDIQISSNLERLLFELYGRDPERTARELAGFAQTGSLGARRRRAGRIARPLRGGDAGRRRDARGDARRVPAGCRFCGTRCAWPRASPRRPASPPRRGRGLRPVPRRRAPASLSARSPRARGPCARDRARRARRAAARGWTRSGCPCSG